MSQSEEPRVRRLLKQGWNACLLLYSLNVNLREALVPRSVDDQEAGKPQLLEVELAHHLAPLLDSLHWDSGCANLLCYTTGLGVLDVCAANLGL